MSEATNTDPEVTVSDVKEYWEANTPQYWYTKAKPGTLEFYNDLQHIRYTNAYPYLPEYAEFNDHSGEKVLEIGCGQGTDLLQFAKGGAEVTGIDLTDGAIAKAREMFDVCGYKATLQPCDAEKLDLFDDDTFDVVYSFGVLHHTPDTDAAFAQVHRVLKPGGKAIIMLYGKGLTWMIAFLYWYLFKLEFLKAPFKQSLSRHAEHGEECPLANYYSKGECREAFHLFKQVQITQLHCYNFEPDPAAVSFLIRVKHALSKTLNATRMTQSIFGHNIIIKATKG